MVQITVETEGVFAKWTSHFLDFYRCSLHVEQETIRTKGIGTLDWYFTALLFLFLFVSGYGLLSEVLLFEREKALEVSLLFQIFLDCFLRKEGPAVRTLYLSRSLVDVTQNVLVCAFLTELMQTVQSCHLLWRELAVADFTRSLRICLSLECRGLRILLEKLSIHKRA